MKKTDNFKAEIIADSITPDGNRLTSFVVVFPRIVLAEFNTHRVFSRNSASSRAIPFKKMLERVETNPFIPLDWMKDHKGMQGSEFFDDEKGKDLEKFWLRARDRAIVMAKVLSEEGLTKQIVNRLLEPWMWHTVIVTATDWANFFALRAHEAAEIHIQHLANVMLAAYNESIPNKIEPYAWHIPFGDTFDEDRLADALDAHSWEPNRGMGSEMDQIKIKIATARCARVSYINYEGNDDYDSDVKLHDNLITMGHMSPLEHCAQYLPGWRAKSGNFQGFRQYRKIFAAENRGDNRIKHKQTK